MSENKYNPAIDLLRLISILAVVLIHTVTRTLEVTGYILDQTPVAFILHQITRFAVPLFFMISGFVLELNYDNHASCWQYITKRLSRIFVPYVFWSAVYFYFIYTQHGPDFISALIYGSASHQLYFIPAILIFYLIFPLFHKLYQIFAHKWVLLVLALFQFYLLFADHYLHSLHLFYPIGVGLYNFYVCLLGMVASHHHEAIISWVKKRLYTLSVITLGLAAFIVFSSRFMYFKTWDIGYFYSNWRPQVLLYTLSFSALGYYLFSRIKLNLNLIKALSGLSFLVFFIHIIVLEQLWRFWAAPLFSATNNQIGRTLWYDSVFFLAVTAVSFLAAFIIHKIPYLKKLTG
ncbi:MAG: acyltransferase [Candidatus Beckwithbacteria bacterium]